MTGFSILDWEKTEAGFVALVLAVTVGISVTQLHIGKIKTRDAQRKADGELVGRALAVYYKQNDRYPGVAEGKIEACGNRGSEACFWGEGKVVDEEGVVYLKILPTDPFTHKGWRYVYEVSDNLQNFRIYAALENTRDKDRKNNLTTVCGENVQCSWYVEN